MENTQIYKQSTTLSIKEESKSPKLKYTFYWQSNPNPFNPQEIQTWDEYDTKNQIQLNINYELFLKDSKNFCFQLLHPSNNYNVDFQKMKQVHKTDTYKIRPIKVNNLFQEISKSDKNKKEEDFLFFWKANLDPWNQKEEPLWSPYDEEDQFILIEAYNNYFNDKSKKIVDLKKPADHFIDFSKMLQINKHNPDKQRSVQRCHPKLVTNIIRKNRFSTSNKNTIFKPDFIEKKTLKEDYDFRNFFKNIKDEKTKKVNIIYFKVFPEFHCKLEIEEELCFFQDEFSIEISLEEIKSILIQEISNLAIDEEKSCGKNNSAQRYKKQIEKIEDYKTFFEKMVYIYTMESYLYKKLNNFLRNMNKIAFENIKYYYTCLLSSFQYFSKNHNLDNNKDLIVYRASKFNKEELQFYKKNNNSNITRIFKEFLSTTIDIKTTQNFFEKNDRNINEFLWEIRIPKDLIINEPYNFADISNSSNFDEKEILIRSGAIINIDQIIPYTEQIGNKTVNYINKFKKICTLKSFSMASFYKLISLDPTIKELNLYNNDLGSNEKNMLYLKEALQNNNSIQTLYLYNNNLGSNEKNMLYLKEALQNNNSIQTLSLNNNNLGSNEKNILYLKEALQNNNSIQTLNLGLNNLGSNEKNMLYLKEALQNNNSIQTLNLGWNNLGSNEKNMLYLKEALQNNNSIQTLNLNDNDLGSNEKNMLYLKEALQNNNSIQTLNLSANYLESNEKILMDIIKRKKSNCNIYYQDF